MFYNAPTLLIVPPLCGAEFLGEELGWGPPPEPIPASTKRILIIRDPLTRCLEAHRGSRIPFKIWIKAAKLPSCNSYCPNPDEVIDYDYLHKHLPVPAPPLSQEFEEEPCLASRVFIRQLYADDYKLLAEF